VAAADTASDLTTRRDLGIAWMNRGHSQLLLNNPTGDAAALAAYAEAIALLRPLPPAGNPSWANSLGAALMNYGQLLHRVHGTARADEALAAFEAAAAVLRPLPAEDNPWPRRNLAGTQINRANLLLDLQRWTEAAAAAREALALSQPGELGGLVDADLTLKARRALGDALGQLLVAPGADQEALAVEASDVVDDAMALIRHWAARGEKNFRPLAVRFFHYGTHLYRFHQPHFLAEFIRENLALADELRPIAQKTVAVALTDPTPAGLYLTLGDAATERHLQTRRELETLRAQLAS
jgi:tetratricopeptide (TPR) repeat protein